MKTMKSDKLTFWGFLKKDWVREYLKRIAFVIVIILVFNYVAGYVTSLPIKVDPYDVLTMRCTVTNDKITVDVKDWTDNKGPEKKPEDVKCRFDDISKTLYISLIMSNDGRSEVYSEFPIKNEFKGLKKVVIEGGILNIHQKTIWYDGEETIAVKPSPTPAESKRGR